MLAASPPPRLSCASRGPTGISVPLSHVSLYPGLEGSLLGSQAVPTLCAPLPHALQVNVFLSLPCLEH